MTPTVTSHTGDSTHILLLLRTHTQQWHHCNWRLWWLGNILWLVLLSVWLASDSSNSSDSTHLCQLDTHVTQKICLLRFFWVLSKPGVYSESPVSWTEELQMSSDPKQWVIQSSEITTVVTRFQENREKNLKGWSIFWLDFFHCDGLDLYQSREERHFLQTDFYISF